MHLLLLSHSQHSEASYHNMTVGRLPSIEGGIQPTIVDAKGDLITAVAADTPARIAVGANDTVLTADSTTATGLKWAAVSGINPNIVDAKGDIIAATAADTVARLSVGANDTVLTADSTTATGLKWAAPASGGMDSLATGSLSGASVTISSISASYKNLQLVIRDWFPDTNDRQVAIQFNGDTGTNYYGYTISTNSGGSVSGPVQSSNPQIAIPAPAINTNQRNFAVYDIFDYANTTSSKSVFGQGSSTDSSGFFRLATTNYYWNDASAINSITIKLNANNYSGGTYILYGVK